MSFMKKTILLLILALILVTLMVTVTFINTGRELEEKTIETMIYDAREIRSKVDDVITDVYSISDTFASEPRLTDFLDRTYSEADELKKRYSTVYILNNLFVGYNILERNNKIAAIYTYKNELFNFVDPNNDGNKIIGQLLDMAIDDEERLGTFYWYPVMDNFLVTQSYDNPRQDKVIFGTRRVFSPLKARYAYIHIFAVQEEAFFEKYRNISEQLNAEVYIINAQGHLISSSNESALADGITEKVWLQQVVKSIDSEGTIELSTDRRDYYLTFSKSEINGWRSVILVPKDTIVASTRSLYFKVVWIISGSIIFYILIIYYMYSGFMNPINHLMKSMRKVDEGDLEQNIDVIGGKEIRTMLSQYNSMVRSIKYNIKERLESDRRKQALEYEVLMSQVNPHFLYNTLESIVWMATDAKRPDIRRLAASLGRLYRLSVGDGEELVNVTREIEHVGAYCQIQKNRFQDRFNLTLDADPEVTGHLYTIKMILQPIVENIFLYAIEPVEHRVDIHIRLKVFEDVIRFYICDNGSGMDSNTVDAVRTELLSGKAERKSDRRSTGIGLGSVYHRLKLHYPEVGDLKIYSKKGRGTVVILTMPRIDNKEPIQTMEDTTV